ncbi:hypothetical protein GCM10028819_09530 [Spirosoma humi]
MIRSIKSLLTLSSLGLLMLSASCHNAGNKNQKEADTTAQNETAQQRVPTNDQPSKKFDSSTIPVSTHELGAFPFFSLPKGLAEQNKPVQRMFDKLYFPLDGVMTPLEGKVWKSYIVTQSGNTDEWSLPYFEKSYDEAIKSVGGVKVFDGQITSQEYDRYHDQASYLGEDGSIGYTEENIKVYLIRRADGSDVYIQLSGNNASGKLNILQKEAFKQTVTLLKADQIQRQLTQTGKAILYINFDVDQATLKADGRDAVKEIGAVLTGDKSLKLRIEGYTDDTGNAAHNKTLSEERAKTVLRELTASGIDASRLTAVGYGAQKPLAPNDSEANRAKNRRVELVKLGQTGS